MKRNLLIILAAMIMTSFSALAQSYSATFRSASPKEAVAILRKATGHDFVYQKSLLDAIKANVNGNYKNLSLTDLLDRTVVNQLNMSYKVTGNTVTLNKAEEKPVNKNEITGIVVDEQGEPLPGVTIFVKGQKGLGTATDINGHYSINVTEPVNELTFSYVGMKPQTIKAKAGSSVPVRLMSMTSELDEMVVTGYQTISKERAAGSFTKVDAKDLKAQTISSVDGMLEGHVAGYSQGRIRGVTSMQGVTSPLYVVDGFPVESTRVGYAGGGFSEYSPSINVDDIESITVLKDAAATSIYGARAANGVVVITTKRANKGKLNVRASATFSANPYSHYKEYLADSSDIIGEARAWMKQNPNFQGPGAQSYSERMLTAYDNLSPEKKTVYQYYAGVISEKEFNDKFDKWEKMGYNYYDEVDKLQYRTSTSQRYNLNISSSSDRNNFVATIAYNRFNSSLKDSWSQDFDVSIRNRLDMTRWLTLDLGTAVIYESSYSPSYNLYNPGFATTPFMSLYNEDGSTYISKMEERISESRLNTINRYGLYSEDIDPFHDRGLSNTTSSNLTTRLQAKLNLKFTDWLNFSTQFQYEFGNYHDKEFQDKTTYNVRKAINDFASTDDEINAIYNKPYGDIYQHGINSQQAWNFRTQLDFDKTFAEIHQVTAIAGMEMRHNKTRYESNTYYGYDEQLLKWTTVDQTSIQSINGALFGYPWIGQNEFAWLREIMNRFISFYGNVAYSYDDKYILNGSIRTDRTNLYGTSSKYQGKPTWSVGAAWRIEREKFMYGIEWVNLLKLRASYGIGGNIAKDQWPYMVAYYTTNTTPGVGGTSGTISSRANPSLRWEKTTTFNIGVDFALFNNRLGGSLEYYNKKGTDLLASVNGVSVEGQGYFTNTMNNGEMTNRGVELQLNGDVIRLKDWTWNLQGVLGYNHSNVDYVSCEAPDFFSMLYYSQQYPRIGKPYTAYYGYQWEGLNEEGFPQVSDADGKIYKYYPPSKVEDLVYLGSFTPTWNGSFTTNLRYKDFTLSALLMFEGGHVMQCPQYRFKDRWKEPGDEKFTNIPKYTATENYMEPAIDMSMYTNSSAVIKDATNLKIRNIALMYNIPYSICSKFYANEVYLRFAVENVATFAKSRIAKYSMNGFEKPNYVISLNLTF